MRFVYWTQQFWPFVGGVEVLGTKYVAAMRARGHEPVVVTGHGPRRRPDTEVHEATPIHRLPFHDALTCGDPALVLETARTVRTLLDDIGPDLIHVNITDPSVFFLLRARHPTPAGDAPWVVSMRVAPDVAGAGAGSILGDALRRAAAISVASRAVVDELEALAPGVAARSVVIPNGLDTDGPEPTDPPTGPPVIAGLGRLVTDKGFDTAVDAFAQVAPDHPSARLVIGGDGPERTPLAARARALGVGGAVDLPGWVPPDRVRSFHAAASFVVMPSRWREAFGLVAVEAMLSGRAVIASDTGGLPEVVLHGRTGLLVAPEDPDALAAAMASLLDDPAWATELGRAGRLHALERFGLDRYVAEHETLYTDVVTSRRKS
ncbi:MAG: glycosyltransferase family 4 protein [Acidimicrobiales bacterium]